MNSPRKKTFYQATRGLHLYLGLFISPFLLLYAISTLFLNHSVRPSPADSQPQKVSLQLAEGIEPKALVSSVLEQLELSGEVSGGRAIRNNRTTLRVVRPGSIKIINVDIGAQEATVVERSTGLLGAINFLHFNPGLHRQPNWIITKFWGWIADATVYLTLFLTVSGIYLWALMKAERKAGLIALGTGLLTFVGLLALFFIN